MAVRPRHDPFRRLPGDQSSRRHGKAYAYPRCFSSNESTDILAIMGWALDLVGVEWRYNRPNSISIARRASVALMDEQIGPKT